MSLSDSNATNSILSRSPDAYLYGSLAEAYLTFSMNSAPLSMQRFNPRSNRSRLTARITAPGRCKSAAFTSAKCSSGELNNVCDVDYLENKILDHVLGTTAYAHPSTVYIGLSTGLG